MSDIDNVIIASYYEYDEADYEEIGGITSYGGEVVEFMIELADVLVDAA